jgi:cytochrome c oxidase assembly protein subunit 15
MMGDEWFPAATPMLEPWIRNLADNPIVVQFVHRWLAFLVAAVAIWLGIRTWARGLRFDGALLIGAVLAQILLGILTILSGVQIDIAVAHQGMAALLLAAMVNAAYGVGRTQAAPAP